MGTLCETFAEVWVGQHSEARHECGRGDNGFLTCRIIGGMDWMGIRALAATLDARADIL